MKPFNYICMAFGVLLITACSSGRSYTDSYNSPWGTSQTSQRIQTATVDNQMEQLEPQVDWQDSRNIQNRLPEGNSATVASVERSTTISGAAATPAAPSPKVKVALLAPLTGQHETIGNALLNAAQLALFDVGNDNYELVPRDTKGTPEGARAAAQSAITQGADLIIGPLFSGSVTAVSPVARAADVPVVAFSTDWNVAGNGTYVMGFLPYMQVARVTNYAVDQGYDRIGLFAPEGEYGRMVNTTLKNVAASNNAQIVKTDIYPADATDLNSRLSVFAENETRKASGYTSPVPFNAIMMPVGGQAIRTLAPRLPQNGIDSGTVKLLGTGLWDDATLGREVALQGAWFAAPDPKLRRDFERNYRNTYGGEPPRIATLAYDATALSAILAQSAAGLSEDEVYTRSRLTSSRGYAGIDGIFRFRPDGLIERGLAVQEITRTGTRVIDPAPTAFVSGQKS